jgi:hypothetical protein
MFIPSWGGKQGAKHMDHRGYIYTDHDNINEHNKNKHNS